MAGGGCLAVYAYAKFDTNRQHDPNRLYRPYLYTLHTQPHADNHPDAYFYLYTAVWLNYNTVSSRSRRWANHRVFCSLPDRGQDWRLYQFVLVSRQWH